ncbi:hypothetical protein [Neptuniibacter sp. QD37_11]|uniref:hypothetical protein n=1 Tax=Neptuniibacter sp. QD37_11 TaxID=3398209 RepID=UPI0039F5BB3B
MTPKNAAQYNRLHGEYNQVYAELKNREDMLNALIGRAHDLDRSNNNEFLQLMIISEKITERQDEIKMLSDLKEEKQAEMIRLCLPTEEEVDHFNLHKDENPSKPF